METRPGLCSFPTAAFPTRASYISTLVFAAVFGPVVSNHYHGVVSKIGYDGNGGGNLGYSEEDEPGITFATAPAGKAGPVVEGGGDERKDHRLRPPNFVVLFADDLGYADVGFNTADETDGRNRHRTKSSFTPTLDELIASMGIRLTDFHSAASTCSPSRASLLTGRLGIRNGVVDNFLPASVGGLPLEEVTLPEILRAANYSTGMIGKWHLGLVDKYHPVSRGFSYYFGVPYSLDMGCSDDPGFNKPMDEPCDRTSSSSAMPAGDRSDPDDGGESRTSDQRNPFHSLALPLMENRKILHQPVDLSQVGDMYAEKAADFIHRASLDSSPFFLYVAFSHVHVPLDVATRFKNASGVGPFQDALLEMDDVVRRIVEALKYAGVFDNTMIWFASDNGPWEVKCDFAGSAKPFNGQWQRNEGGGGSGSKQTIWEGGHRVPGFIHYPKEQHAREAIFDGITSTLDVFPTILGLAHVSLPSDRHFDGMDLSPVIGRHEDENDDSKEAVMRQFRNRVLFHPASGAAGKIGEIAAVRFANHKAVYFTGGATPDCENRSGPDEHHKNPLIFDLGSDPAESTPLPQDDSDTKKLQGEAQILLRRFMDDVRGDATHTADYRTDPSEVPCCNHSFSNCRCR